MRISDWSSDVCSSDLLACPPRRPIAELVDGTAENPGLDRLTHQLGGCLGMVIPVDSHGSFQRHAIGGAAQLHAGIGSGNGRPAALAIDRTSTRLNSSH